MTDTARSAVDEHLLPRSDVRPLDETLPRGDHGQGPGRRLAQVIDDGAGASSRASTAAYSASEP